MICPKCLYENDEGSDYCTNCGADLNPSVNSSSKILTILGLVSTILLTITSIFVTKYSYDSLSMYTNMANYASSAVGSYSGLVNSMYQPSIIAFQALCNRFLILTLVLFVVVLLAIISLILISKKDIIAKYTLAICGAIIAILIVPIMPALAASSNASYNDTLMQAANSFAHTFCIICIVSLAIIAALYFIAAFLYKPNPQ